ncbi:MarR family winged helix-turn-helix transcriptional regulator [Pseudohoeflea coraliihabitans]|uniref:MarR family transcriptional regulator n=1 Tax=Pseudohoeflea coraliihabitans TaxID=2860393 RepID=A0ABS6WLW0_9HYPH|nr:MarR family transcriptional regulator [Pseudohoeflea sp. DP4N28-3]MBW3096402.1 MarR family transcriptional regulator [Pseudohoeflea sp. DP4N28-3]
MRDSDDKTSAGGRPEDISRVEYGLTRMVRLLEALARQRDDPLDRAHYLMLRHLEKGLIRIGDLSEVLALDATTVTRQVTAMEERGLVVRRVNELDRRSALVERTEKGAELVEDMRKSRIQRLDELLADWPEHDVTLFAAALERFDTYLYAELRAYREGTAG